MYPNSLPKVRRHDRHNPLLEGTNRRALGQCAPPTATVRRCATIAPVRTRRRPDARRDAEAADHPVIHLNRPDGRTRTLIAELHRAVEVAAARPKQPRRSPARSATTPADSSPGFRTAGAAEARVRALGNVGTGAVGFHTGIEYRFAAGSFSEPGPAVCWIRLKHPIVAGTTPSPLERTLAAADSGNGVSSVLDWNSYLFINTDLTVTLHRQPAGEWVCLDAVTHPQPHGIGLAESALFDEKGPLGRSTQTLFLGPR